MMKQVEWWAWRMGVVLALACSGLSSALSPQVMAWQNGDFDSDQGPGSYVSSPLDLTDQDTMDEEVTGRGGFPHESLLASLMVLGLRDIQQHDATHTGFSSESYTSRASEPIFIKPFKERNYVSNINLRESNPSFVGNDKVLESASVNTLKASYSAITDGMRDQGFPTDKTSAKLSSLHISLMTNIAPVTSGNDHKTQLVQYLEGIQRDAWGQFKSTALGYLQLLEHEYENQELKERLPLSFMKYVFQLGDKLNIIHELGRKVDPGLKEFLKDMVHSLISLVPGLTAGGSLLSIVKGGIVKDAAWKALHQFINHVLWVVRDYVTKEELEKYKAELQMRAPLAAFGMDLVLGNPYPSQLTEEGRSYMTRQGYGGSYNDGFYGGSIQNKGNSDGYGGHGSGSSVGYGGYGSHDGYGTSSYGQGYGVYLDPYLVLAGLGAAALLGYLGYKVILSKTTSLGRRRRSTDELAFSDIVDLTQNIYTSLEETEAKYGFPSPLEDLLQGMNSVWQEHMSDSGCARCSVADFVLTHTATEQDHLKAIINVGLAHMLGLPRSGQLLDEVTSRVLEGRLATCVKRGNTCVFERHDMP